MSANSLLVSQASAVSGVDTAGAIARISGDAANVLPSSELSLVQKGGMHRVGGKRKTKGRKTKARKSMWYSGGSRRKSRSQKRRR
jgi:hypothetical protein